MVSISYSQNLHKTLQLNYFVLEQALSIMALTANRDVFIFSYEYNGSKFKFSTFHESRDFLHGSISRHDLQSKKNRRVNFLSKRERRVMKLLPHLQKINFEVLSLYFTWSN